MGHGLNMVHWRLAREAANVTPPADTVTRLAVTGQVGLTVIAHEPGAVSPLKGIHSMDATTLDYQRYNPCRAVDHRWQDARRAAADPVPSSPPRDPETAAAADYLRELALGSDTARLERCWPGLRAAQDLAAADTSVRWEVQARILAGQTDDEIATRCGLAPAAVRWFEALFFRVRDRLRGTDWIASQVMGPGLWDGFGPGELGKVWMIFGHSAGPDALDLVIAVTQDRPLPASARAPEGVDPRLHETRLRLACRLAVAARMIRSAADVAVLRRLYRARRRLERAAGLPDRPDPVIEAQLDLLARGAVRRRRARRRDAPAELPPTAAGERGGQATRRQRRSARQPVTE
jgi:hypothetical protein